MKRIIQGLAVLALCFFLQILAVNTCKAQSGNFTFDIYSGVSAGWWVFNHIVEDQNKDAHLAQDKTHLSLMVPVGLEMMIAINKLKFGAGCTYRTIYDNVMTTSNHSPSNYQVYQVAVSNVNFLQYHIAAEYALSTGIDSKFRFSPQIKVGSFQLYASHPNESDFGRKYFFEACFKIERKMSPFTSIFIQPHYLLMSIEGERKNNKRDMYHIYGTGLQMGIRFIIPADEE